MHGIRAVSLCLEPSAYRPDTTTQLRAPAHSLGSTPHDVLFQLACFKENQTKGSFCEKSYRLCL
eukprot:358699-Chlamydomonas_euryale.AAC.1